MLTSYIPFNITLSDGKIIPVRDIFVFNNFLTSLFSDNQFIMRYTIKSGDTPSSLSYYLYSSERYEWLIYCLNGIVNPYYDWPLSEDDFYDMIEAKYLNKTCFFLGMDGLSNFKVGETVSNGMSHATVDSWDRTLCKLTVKNIQGPVEFDEGQTITQSSGGSGEITRIVERAEDALHHFETESGVHLDPYVGYLQGYLTSTSDLYAITNKQFEEKLNDSKRQIYILKPEFAKTAENLLVRNINRLSKFESENIFK